MKTRLPLKKLQFLTLLALLLVIPGMTIAQDLEWKKEDAPKKGHALYKQAKIYDNQSGAVGVKPKAFGDKAMDRWLFEQQQLRNPTTQKLPYDIKRLEQLFSEKILERSLDQETAAKGRETSAKSRFSYWRNRGPGNVGGRTRALALDLKNENTILAGGVSGGLWRSTNAGKSWRKVTFSFQSPSITAIVQDPRKGKNRIWYYASGERFGNSASAGGAFYQGTGIYKSVNNGQTWFRINDSNDDDVTTISSLDIINSLAIDPKNGDLYAATFNGVFRSKNGGKDLEEVLPSAFDSYTEVITTPSGKIYATVDFFGAENSGFFVSDDGDTWTNITPPGISPFFGRTVMGVDPADENRIFFFSDNLLASPEAFLWRYQADAATPEEQWVDLSANLPTTIGGPVGDLNLQGGYNMVVKVHPDNPDIVFLGGTNLYRSVTGFTTPTAAEGWIGGYSIVNDISIYPNQHPDQHNLVFLPSDPDIAIAATDGGVHRTEDISDTSAPVLWSSLNNNYITTQPYAISFDPEANSDDLLAGFQDNGTWFTDSKSLNDPWIEDFSGDGTYNAIADGGLTRYVSAQFGVVFRLNFDENGDFVSFTRVQPAGASGFAFVAPFVLDPNNDNIMYMPAGDRIWRNNNLDEIPLFSNAPTTVNWVEQTQTATSDQSPITALDVSKFPVANRLYYGTASGLIYKVENANIDEQPAIDISSGKGLPPGFVNNIYVDPKNPDRVFVVFSNYGIPSIFMTRDAGNSWKDISGNLEESPDGSGNGPSVRWFAMNGNNDGYFAGTSTGLYFAFRLRGKQTRWFREPLRIGNGVVTQVRTRGDGFVAAGVHGNGVYSANFFVRPRPEPSLSVAYLLSDLTVSKNSDPFTVDIPDLFVSSKNKKITIELTNSNPALVSASLDGDQINISVTPDAEGSAAIGLVATSGREKVSEGFTINVVEPAIYEQNGPVTFSSPSQFFLDFGGLVQSADDFTVPEGSTWKISSIIAQGAVDGSPQLTDASIAIFNTQNGMPAEEIYNSGSITPTSEPTDANLALELPEELVLESGSYWITVYANLAFEGANIWSWATQASVTGDEAHFRDLLDLFGTGAIDWTPQSVVFNAPPEDQVFQLFGTIEESSEAEEAPSSFATSLAEEELQNLATLEVTETTAVWPNPSSSQFFFSLRNSEDEKVSARVYNLLGQMVHEEKNISSGQPFSWDASSAPSGIYLVRIQGQKTNRSFKLLKQ